MGSREATGKRGEAIFVRAIMSFCGNAISYFNPVFLGEKYEALDYLVELIGVERTTPFFFVQVKTTRLGYTSDPNDRRLRSKCRRRASRKSSAIRLRLISSALMSRSLAHLSWRSWTERPAACPA
jgi:hypothetical protein